MNVQINEQSACALIDTGCTKLYWDLQYEQLKQVGVKKLSLLMGE